MTFIKIHKGKVVLDVCEFCRSQSWQILHMATLYFHFVNTSFCRSPYGHYPWKAGKVFKKENTCYMYMYFCRIVQRGKKGGTILQAKLWWAELYRYVKQYAQKAGKVFQKERIVSCTYKKRNENTCYMYMYFCRIVQRGKRGGGHHLRR